MNQRDFAPFQSQHRSGLAESELTLWQQLYEQGATALLAGDKTSAQKFWREALSLDNRHAELNFRLGRLLLSENRDAEAREFLTRACDLDTLRFRTDSRLNTVIRGLCDTEASLFTLVDLQAKLAERSAHGISGDEFLYEHVHLNLRGTYEAACVLLPRILKDLHTRGLLISAPANPTPLSYELLRQRLAFTTHEQAMIQLSLLRRYRAAPFTGQTDNAQRLSTTERRASTAQALLARPEALPTLRGIYDEALKQSPEDWILARNAGAMLLARQLPAEALAPLKRAQVWIDDDIDTLVPLGLALRALGREQEAEDIFTKARKLEPRYPGLPEARAQTH